MTNQAAGSCAGLCFDHAYHKALGPLVKQARLDYRMTLRQLGECLWPRVAPPTLHGYEQGARRYTVVMLEKICSVIRADPAVLMAQAYALAMNNLTCPGCRLTLVNVRVNAVALKAEAARREAARRDKEHAERRDAQRVNKDRAQLAAQLGPRYAQGHSLETLAAEIDRSPRYVARLLEEVGVTLRRYKNRGRPTRFGKEARARIAQELKLRYEDNPSVTIRSLVEDTHYPFGTVRSLLLEAGAELRPRGRQRQER